MRCPGSSTSGAETSPYPAPLHLEAEMANRDTVSPQAIAILVVAENSERNSQLLHQAWRAIQRVAPSSILLLFGSAVWHKRAVL